MSRTTRRLPAATVGLAVLATLLVAAPSAHASRTVSESYTVPADGRLRLTGHGYGHGHGMSQYGAQGAALKGLSFQQILAYYYPGTTLGSTTGTIRVLITADTDNDVRVVAGSGLKVRDVSSGSAWTLPASGNIKNWRLRTVSGSTRLEYDNGAWHAYRPGGSTLTGDAEFFRSGSLTLRVGGGTRAYRGALRLSSTNTVNVLGMDDYVKGVVPREMPASWRAAAVRAQAVAARTYGAWDRAAHASRYYHTCDTTSCQVYGGVGAEDSRSNAAVVATARRVLNYQGKPAFTQFGSSSGGWLAAGSMPYLVAKADKYDGFSGNSMHTWTTTVTRAAVQRAWPSLGTLKRVLVTRRDGHGDWSGRVEEMTLDGSRKDVTISGNTFRSQFGLRSNWFRLGTGSTSSTPSTPAAGQSPPTRRADSPIYKRWKALGGVSSVMGRPRGPEYSVGSGRVRHFQKGRMFYQAGVGTRALNRGRVLRAYLRRGGADSRLGFPTTRTLRIGKLTYARFEKGLIIARKHRRVRVSYHR